MPTVRTLGVLLAGGRGSRLQLGVPKALIACGGCSLLARAMATLEQLCDPVVVVAPHDMALPVPAEQRIADLPGAQGPLAALIAGLGSRRFEDALVLGVDFPLLTPGALAGLRSLRGEAAAVLPVISGTPQPLAAWYSPRAFPVLAAALAAGVRSVTQAVMTLAPRLVGDAELAVLPGGSAAYLNLNTPADLAEAERRLSPGTRA
jgi:molybdopterin-guanine dinucleotide biosynthesis protein A